MSADTQIKEILDRYGENFAESTWVVPGGKARAIKHPVIERMAAKAGIRFDLPQIIDASPENVVIIVSGSMPGAEPVWSFGEANPKNNKNAYFYAMAEKRAKGRVALKLLNLHGLLYSEEEADDFRQAKPARTSETPEPKPDAPAPDNVVSMRNESEERFEADLRAKIGAIKTSGAVTGFMLQTETQRILGLLGDVAREDVRQYAKERLLALRNAVREAE